MRSGERISTQLLKARNESSQTNQRPRSIYLIAKKYRRQTRTSSRFRNNVYAAQIWRRVYPHWNWQLALRSRESASSKCLFRRLRRRSSNHPFFFQFHVLERDSGECEQTNKQTKKHNRDALNFFWRHRASINSSWLTFQVGPRKIASYRMHVWTRILSPACRLQLYWSATKNVPKLRAEELRKIVVTLPRYS